MNDKPFRGSLAIALAVLAAGALLATGCGSSGAVTDAPGAPDAKESDDQSAAAPASEGAGSGTLTLDDGTVYDLTMTTCDTSTTDPAALPLDDGYSIFSQAPDGTEFSIGLVGFTNDDAFFNGSLTGTGDNDGNEHEWLYTVRQESVDVTVDGGSVSGSLSFTALVPFRPLGDEIGAQLDVNC